MIDCKKVVNSLNSILSTNKPRSKINILEVTNKENKEIEIKIN